MAAWRKADMTIGDGQWGFGTVWGGPSGDAGVYPITSPFGPRDQFIAGGALTSGFHQGLDIGYPEGVPLVAMFDCIVTGVSTDNPAYGNFVIYSPADLDVDDDEWCAIWYGHMSDVVVTQGQRLAAGDLIGHVGQTGMARGPHLHLELRNRMGPTDPFNALMRGGIGIDPDGPDAPYEPLTREQVVGLLESGANYVDLGPATSAVVVFKGA